MSRSSRLRRVEYTSSKAVSMNAIGTFISATPISAATLPITLPASVAGYMSPYPTLVKVITAHHMHVGMFSKGCPSATASFSA